MELYGLGVEVPAHLNLIEITRSERTEMEPRLPIHLLPLYNDGAGNHYCLDTGQFEGDQCPVVFWNHELDRNQAPEYVARDFEAWLREELDWLVENQTGKGGHG